jgi:hypothetical protein
MPLPIGAMASIGIDAANIALDERFAVAHRA